MSGVTRKQFSMACTRIANQNWIDLPSAEIRTKTIEICRKIEEKIVKLAAVDKSLLIFPIIEFSKNP